VVLIEPKIVFTGPPGAGKTTAIAALSDVVPVSTDVANHDVSLIKARTTVGLDFGYVQLGEGEAVRLYGTPGQRRFDFMWRILLRNAIGVVLLADNSSPDALADVEQFLATLSDELRGMPCVVGVGRTESAPGPSLDDYAALLERYGHVYPVLPVDVRQRADVLMLVEMLLAQAEARAALEGEDHHG
jgi:uncharacterized protein